MAGANDSGHVQTPGMPSAAAEASAPSVWSLTREVRTAREP